MKLSEFANIIYEKYRARQNILYMRIKELTALMGIFICFFLPWDIITDYKNIAFFAVLMVAYFVSVRLYYTFKDRLQKHSNIFEIIFVIAENLIITYVAISGIPHAADYYLLSTTRTLHIFIILSTYMTSHRYVVVVGVVSAIITQTTIFIHLTVFTDFYERYNIQLLHEIIGWLNCVAYNLIFIVIGIFLYNEHGSRYSLIDTIIYKYVDKVITGAHKALSAHNGTHVFNGWQVYTTITSAKDALLGSDFVSLRQNQNGTVTGIIGDIISHGIDTSQGAFACLASFLSARTTKPSTMIKDLNSMLSNISAEYGGEGHVLVFTLHKSSISMHGSAEIDVGYVSQTRGIMKKIKVENYILGKGKNTDDFDTVDVIMEPGDMIILKTDGWENLDTDDDRTLVVITKT